MMNTTILCPFVNQVNLINKFLEESGIHEVKAGTIHTMQGAENDTVILSTAISHKTQRRTYEWVKNNSELFNVASTRAKKKFIIYITTRMRTVPALRLGAYQIFFHFQLVRMFLPLPSGCMGQGTIGLSADLLKGLSCSLGFTGQQKAQKKMRLKSCALILHQLLRKSSHP